MRQNQIDWTKWKVIIHKPTENNQHMSLPPPSQVSPIFPFRVHTTLRLTHSNLILVLFLFHSRLQLFLLCTVRAAQGRRHCVGFLLSLNFDCLVFWYFLKYIIYLMSIRQAVASMGRSLKVCLGFGRIWKWCCKCQKTSSWFSAYTCSPILDMYLMHLMMRREWGFCDLVITRASHACLVTLQ